MAIDSENKRRSILGLSTVGSVLPVADSNMTAGDRQDLVGVYRGILVYQGAPPSGDITPMAMYHYRRRR